MVTPTFYGELFLLLVFVIATFYAGKKIGIEIGIEIGGKRYKGKLLQIDDLLVNELFTVLGIAPSDSGNKDPRFVMLQLMGKRNSDSPSTDWFGVDVAISKVTDPEGNIRIHAGNVIRITPEGIIEVVS